MHVNFKVKSVAIKCADGPGIPNTWTATQECYSSLMDNGNLYFYMKWIKPKKRGGFHLDVKCKNRYSNFRGALKFELLNLIIDSRSTFSLHIDDIVKMLGFIKR